MRKIYIFNAMVVPVAHGEALVKISKADLEQVKETIQLYRDVYGYEVVSAVGHASTASLLSELFGFEVPVNRIKAEMERGDVGIHFVLSIRLEEGRILNGQELRELLDKSSFYISKIIGGVSNG